MGRTVMPVGKPDAGNQHVRFDERGRETERAPQSTATAPVLDSTNSRCTHKIPGEPRQPASAAPTVFRWRLRKRTPGPPPSRQCALPSQHSNSLVFVDPRERRELRTISPSLPSIRGRRPHCFSAAGRVHPYFSGPLFRIRMPGASPLVNSMPADSSADWMDARLEP